MANPAGTTKAKWNQAVNAVAAAAGWTTAQADTWLNDVWVGMWQGDERAGQPVVHGHLRAWLEGQVPSAVTLPRAFQARVT